MFSCIFAASAEKLLPRVCVYVNLAVHQSQNQSQVANVLSERVRIAKLLGERSQHLHANVERILIWKQAVRDQTLESQIYLTSKIL